MPAIGKMISPLPKDRCSGENKLKTDQVEQSCLIEKDVDEFTILRSGKRYLVTDKRWITLGLVCVISLLNMFGVMFFSFIYDLVSAYFRTSPAETDLISTISQATRGVSSLFVAMLSDIMDLRTLALSTTATLCIGDVLVAVGVSSRKNFAILIAGQVVSGPAVAMGITVSEMLSRNWFPVREQGRAIGATLLFTRVSQLISNIGATRALGISLYEIRANETSNGSSFGYDMMKKFGGTSSIVFIAAALTALLLFVLSQMLITDYPPQVGGKHYETPQNIAWSPLVSLWSILLLFKSKPFLLLLLHTVLFLSVHPLIGALQTSIVRSGFPGVDEQAAGTLYCVGLAVGSFGAICGGLLLDRFQNPKWTYIGGIMFTSIGCCLFSLAIYTQNVGSLFLGYILVNFFRDVLLITTLLSAINIVTNESPSTSLKVFCILGSLPSASPFAYTIIIREAMNVFDPSAAVLVPLPFLLLSGALWACHHKCFDTLSLSGS